MICTYESFRIVSDLRAADCRDLDAGTGGEVGHIPQRCSFLAFPGDNPTK